MVPCPRLKVQFSFEINMTMTLLKLIPMERVTEHTSPTSALKIMFKWDLNDIWSFCWPSPQE